MRFSKKVPFEVRSFLEEQYKEYCKKTSMTKKERNELKKWIYAGNSPYDGLGGWNDYGPLTFIEEYRLLEELSHMSEEEAKEFMGWVDDDESSETLEEFLKSLEEPFDYEKYLKESETFIMYTEEDDN